jgi:hypothetical protein
VISFSDYLFAFGSSNRLCDLSKDAGVCNIVLRNFDKCVGCFLCGIKQHIKCLELEDDSFKFVSRKCTQKF